MAKQWAVFPAGQALTWKLTLEGCWRAGFWKKGERGGYALVPVAHDNSFGLKVCYQKVEDGFEGGGNRVGRRHLDALGGEDAGHGRGGEACDSEEAVDNHPALS